MKVIDRSDGDPELEDEVQDLDGDQEKIREALQGVTCSSEGCGTLVGEDEDRCPYCRDDGGGPS